MHSVLALKLGVTVYEPWPRLPRPRQLPLHSNQPLPLGNRQARHFVTHSMCFDAPTVDKCCHESAGESTLPLQNRQVRTSERLCGKKDIGPTCTFTESPEVDLRATVGTLQTGYPRIQALSQDTRQGRCPHTTTWPTTLDPTTQHKRAPALPLVPPLQTLPPSTEGLQCCRVSRSFEPRLLTREGSGVAMCPVAPDPASQCGRAPVRPRVLWHLASYVL
jgi:hypothetical protein